MSNETASCDYCFKDFEWLDCDTHEVERNNEDGDVVGSSSHVYCPHCGESVRVG